MPQSKRLSRRDSDQESIMQVREEPRWPFPVATEPGEEQVIAGILKEPGQERLSVLQAMHRGLVTHGTGLALLEHQAASGYVVDTAQNRLLTVRDARNAGLVDRELLGTLLIAEKAVTGYTDPYTGDKLCLFQAMKRGLLIKDHGIRLLEAQLATGGLIHPRHSHRLPVEVAYKWGYLDTELFHLISDPANHSRRCFDTNARENLTYLQLLPRCVLEPGSGLLMFQVTDNGSVHLSENLRKELRSAGVKVSVGILQGQEVSLWDLLFSRYVSWRQRQELLRHYKAGKVTLQDISQILTATVTGRETQRNPSCGAEPSPAHETGPPEKEEEKVPSGWEEVEKTLKSRVVRSLPEEFHGKKVSVWELLNSKYIPKGKRKELFKLYRMGILSLDQMESVVCAIVARTEEEKAKASGRAPHIAWEDKDPQEAQLRHSLEALRVLVNFGEFKGQRASVWGLLWSKHFPQEKRQELLEAYKAGSLSPGQMAAAVSGALEKAEAGKKKFLVRVKSWRQKEAKAAGTPGSKAGDDLLKATMVTLPAGEAQGQQVSAWDLLSSQYIARDKAEEILAKYRDGKFSIQEVSSILAILASLHDLFSALEQMTPRSGARPTSRDPPGPHGTSDEKREEEEADADHDDDGDGGDDDGDGGDDDVDDPEKDQVLKSRMVTVPVAEFRGRKVSVWDLLHSKYVPEKKQKEILKLYRIGILSADQTEKVVTAIVTQLADHHHENVEGKPKEGGGGAVEMLTFEFPVGEFQGRRVSMWDLLFSKSISEATRKTLLVKYASGALSLQEMVNILTVLITEAHKGASTPNIPHGINVLPPEASCKMFRSPKAQWVSLHDLLAQEQDPQRPGRVTISEVTMTTTVLHGPEHKQGQLGGAERGGC